MTFSVNVTDLDFNPATLTVADFTLNATGTATGTLALTGTGNSRTLTISGITGSGTLGVTLAAHSIADLAGNTNAAAVVSETFSVVNVVPVAVTSVVVNGGTAPIISAAESGKTVTVTTDGPSGLSAGESVLIAGVGAGYNGTYTITGVNSNNTVHLHGGRSRSGQCGRRDRDARRDDVGPAPGQPAFDGRQHRLHIQPGGEFGR